MTFTHIQNSSLWTTSNTNDLNKEMGIYYTHDNGIRPYKIIIHKDSTNIDIYYNYSNNNYDLLLNYTTNKIWIGESPLSEMTEFGGGHGENFLGNSILIELENNKYIFIGHIIFSFTPQNKIIKYMSEVGNNDVPYPYAVDSNNNYYLIIEEIILKNIPKDFNDNPYYYYYNNKDKYGDILGINELVTYNNYNSNDSNINNPEYFKIAFHVDPRRHYNMPWMKNLYIVNNETGSENSLISEDDYVKMMEKISLECGYEKLEMEIIHKNRYYKRSR
jgi:hypothetical protein